MSNALRRVAVKTVKPLVGETNWQRLRSRAGAAPAPRQLTPQQKRRRRLMQMNLTELAQEFGTDKWGAHYYTPHYERHLVHLRDEKFTLLEIGIGGYAHQGKGGASLRMWKHFFRRAQILGLDIQDKSFVDAPRIKSYCGSQTDEDVLKLIVADAEDLRVVIDDGSHRPEHIRETFRMLFPMLPSGAIYAIEDTHTSYWPSWGGSTDLNDPTTTMALVKDLVDGLNYEEFLDDSYEPSYSDKHVVAVHCYHNLVIIEKGENNEGATRARKKALAAELRAGAATGA